MTIWLRNFYFQGSIHGKLYATFGVPSAGKTKLLVEIRNQFSQKCFCKTTSLLKKNGSPFTRYLQELFGHGDDRLSNKKFFKFQLESFAKRAEDAFYAANIVRHSPEISFSFIDETIYDSYAYANTLVNLRRQRSDDAEKDRWLSEDNFETFHQIFISLMQYVPRPDAIIYLRCTNDKYIEKRHEQSKKTYKYENGYIPQLIIDFDIVAKEMEDEWEMKVITVNIEGKEKDEIYKDVVSQLNLNELK